jgi:hypothetical protein
VFRVVTFVVIRFRRRQRQQVPHRIHAVVHRAHCGFRVLRDLLQRFGRRRGEIGLAVRDREMRQRCEQIVKRPLM